MDMDTGAPVDSEGAKVRPTLTHHWDESIHVWRTYAHYTCSKALVFLAYVNLSLQDEEDYDVMQDPEFLQSVLENLPGVDPNNEAIRNAMGSLASQTGSKPDSKKDKNDEKKKWTFTQ